MIGCFGAEDSRRFAFFSTTWTPVEMFAALIGYRDDHDYGDWDLFDGAFNIEIISVPCDTSIYDEDWDEVTILQAEIAWTWTADYSDTVSTLTVTKSAVPSDMASEITVIVTAWNAKEAAKNLPEDGGSDEA
jgi:hypothetical protein